MGLKNKLVLLLTLFFYVTCLYAQEGALIESVEKTHDFGNIIETDGEVSHEFIIKNTGSAPLVITRVTASCGCTTPDWTKAPIEAGQSGVIKVTYNPKGRPGPFRKSISVGSNGSKTPLQFIVMGNVTSRPPAPAVSYPYNIGDLKLSSRKINFSSIRKDETLSEKLYLRNNGEETIVVKTGKIPAYLTAEVHPEVLQPGETGELTLLYDARTAKKMGRIYNELPLILERLDRKTETGKISITANIIDNPSKNSGRSAPVAHFSATRIEFGVLEEKGSGIIPVLGSGGRSSETLTITNTGKSNLTIYSVTCDNDIVDVSGGKKELKPGGSVTYKISVRPKDIKLKLDTNIYVVSDDPAGPVRLIKVTAEK
ncbi:MAG: DUF1573 domain-containing protein [Tannerellaceae bacterium]|nr:DUF1573 domain-containing protein [Tannerellaceae bacterium]